MKGMNMTSENVDEMDQIEQDRDRDIAATREELAAALRAAGEHLDHAERLTSVLGEGVLYDIEYVDSVDSPDAELFIADAARGIRAAHRIITALP
ncbi:MAG: hypothetical protein C0482_29370 [Gordonia sp.]|nr:hypothetical protein [Gordonia sp. (in: high G+C Gram-positive bacteria)]OZG29710.1 hypothetical protein BH683_007165 [Williamsia sp. 1138]